MMSYQIVKNSRGSRLIDEKNYSYRIERSLSRKTYWKCHFYDKIKCPGRFHTSFDGGWRMVNKHNHGPEDLNSKRLRRGIDDVVIFDSDYIQCHDVAAFVTAELHDDDATKPQEGTSQFVLKDPSPTFQGQSSKPYTGGAKPPSYWEWVREAYPHIQLSEEVIQQLEAESKNNDNITDEASFQEMVDLIMSKEKQKQANDGLKPPELPSTFRGKQSFGAPGKINCH
ncbi:hypothetical protein QYM36_006090, partial [Artemia franciscana]